MEEWIKLLRLIQGAEGVTAAYIVGGALRDLDHGMASAIKDLDIFVCLDERKDYGGFEWVLIQEGYDLEQNCQNYGGLSDDVACSLVYAPPLGGLKVNIIVLTGYMTKHQAAARCDFGICQIATDGVLEYRTHEYNIDKSNKTFTLVTTDRCDQDSSRSIRRFDRLKQKYPDHRLVLP